MRKRYKVLSLALAFGLLGGSIAALATRKVGEVKETEAVLSYEHYVPVNAGNFWTNEFGGVGNVISQGNDTFFDPGRYFGTNRPFINTFRQEDSTGDVRSDNFVQRKGLYVSFLIGGSPCYTDTVNKTGPRNFVNIFAPEEGAGGDLYTGINNNAFTDPNISENMIFKFYQINFADGRDSGNLHVYIHDGSGTAEKEQEIPFRGITFGDLRINQTWDDVVEAYSAHIATYQLSVRNSEDAANKGARDAVLDFYSNDSYYSALNTALAAKTSANDGFEKRNSLTNWAYDRHYSTAVIDFESIISDNDYKQDDYFANALPANKSGNYYISADTSGIGEGEKYRIVSSEFTLSGSGFISAKLGGGTAVLQLLNADCSKVLETTTIAEETGTNYLNPAFHRDDDGRLNIIESGARFNTMSRVYLDCSTHVGERVRVALADARTGGEWGLAYFDDVVTYYQNAPTSFGVERIVQKIGNTEGRYYGVTRDYYIGSSSTNVGKAYAFFESFYDKMRNPANHNSWCEVSKSQDVKNLLSRYEGLESDVKEIVNASQDFVHVDGEGNEYHASDFSQKDVNTTRYTVGDTMAFLSGYTPATSGYKTVNNSLNSNDVVTIAIIVISLIAVASLIGFVTIRRKRKLD